MTNNNFKKSSCILCAYMYWWELLKVFAVREQSQACKKALFSILKPILDLRGKNKGDDSGPWRHMSNNRPPALQTDHWTINVYLFIFWFVLLRRHSFSSTNKYIHFDESLRPDRREFRGPRSHRGAFPTKIHNSQRSGLDATLNGEKSNIFDHRWTRGSVEAWKVLSGIWIFLARTPGFGQRRRRWRWRCVVDRRQGGKRTHLRPNAVRTCTSCSICEFKLCAGSTVTDAAW